MSRGVIENSLLQFFRFRQLDPFNEQVDRNRSLQLVQNVSCPAGPVSEAN